MSDVARVLPWGRDESELIAELRSGSDEAFSWLVTHYHGHVYGLLYGMLGDSADAADSTQEVFLKAFRGIQGFRRGSSLKTWLYRIAVREALNHKRWHWRHQRNQTSLDAGRETDANFGEPENASDTPFDLFAAQEVQQAVQEALQRVPEVYRTAVILRDLEGLDYYEVAEVLDVSIGTVKSRIMRGRHYLREILEPLLESRSERLRSSSPQAEKGQIPFHRKLAGFAAGGGR